MSRRSRSGGGAVSKAWKWLKWCRNGIKSLLGWAVLITLLAHGASGQFFEQITRMASAIARVSESASLAASTVIDRGTDLATTTSTAVLTFATGAANLVETAWQGVDLLNLHCEKTSGVVTAEHNLVLLEWLQSPAGLALMGGNLTVAVSHSVCGLVTSPAADSKGVFVHKRPILEGLWSLLHSFGRFCRA